MTGPCSEDAFAPRPRPWLRDAVPVLLLALAACVLFWRAVLLRGVFFHYDHAIQNFPFRLFFARGLAAGRLPLWTSDLFCGFPLFAESQANALYPPFLLLFGLLPPWVAYNYYTVLHFAMAGAFTYALARAMEVGRAGAFLAGLAYMLAGPLLFHAHHTNIVVGVALLPLLLALMEMACRRRTLPWLLAFAAATGALVLGAQPQYTLYNAVVCGIYLAWRLRLVSLAGGGVRRVLAPAGRFGLAAALGGMLAAVQVLPMLELVAHSSRGVGGPPGVSPGVPGNLLTLLLPRAFGSPGLGSYWGNADPGLYSEVTLFVGAAVLMLALVGAFSDRSRRALFFVGLGLFALIFALGFHGSLYNAIGLLPVFRAARFPSRFAYVMALSTALLAGMGLEKLQRAPQEARVRRAALIAALGTLALSALCLLVVVLTQRGFFGLSRAELKAALPFLPPFELEQIRRHFQCTLPADAARLGGALLLGGGLLLLSVGRIARGPLLAAAWSVLVFAELAPVGAEFAAVTDPAIYSVPPPLVEALAELPPGRILRFRYYDPTPGPRAPAQYPFTQGWALEPALYASSLDRVPPNSNLLWGVPSVDGFSPLQTLALKTLLGRPREQSTLIEFDLTRPLDLLGVRYVLTPRQSIPGDYRPVSTVGAIRIFENPNALPRAFIVHRAEPAPPGDEAVALLRAPGFDYRDRLLVHDADGPLLNTAPGLAAEDESAEVTRDEGDVVTVRARLERPGYLVLADQYYPGWQVTVDGRPRPLLRVDYVLRGVRLEAGEHAVTFTFRPESYRRGAAISLAGLGILAAGIVLCLLRRGSRPAEPEAPWRRAFTARTARFVLLSGVLFLLMGPLLRPALWRDAARELTPRHYAAEFALLKARYAVVDGRLIQAHGILREACRWWPANRPLRAELVDYGEAAVRVLLKAGRPDEARAVAAETVRLAPQEVREKAPELEAIALAR